MAKKKLLKNEELMNKVQMEADEFFNDFKTQRESEEEIWEVSDYMYMCALNRDVYEDEKGRGANIQFDNAEMAQSGSTIWYRYVNQFSAQGMAVQMSRPMPFKYRPIINEGVFFSAEDANEQADLWNTIARWTMKQDKFVTKSMEFWHQLRKYGNIPVMMYQKQQKGKRPQMVPRYEQVGQDYNGYPVMEIVGYDEKMVEGTVANYPCIRILPIDTLYADTTIGEVNSGDCVVVVSWHNMAYFWQGVKDGDFDKEQVEKIKEKDRWDGSSNRTHTEERRKNRGDDIEQPTVATDLFMTFDIFIRAPIKDGEWNDEEGERPWRWLTVAGNTIKDGVPVRFEDNPDPDGEVPITVIHCHPDDDDMLYHTGDAQAIRSNYSVECTLKNIAIDNMGLANRPPIVEVEGMVRGDDRVFKPDAHWIVDDINAIQEMQIRDNTQSIQGLLQWIGDDTQRAIGADNNLVGESFGARTSALEADHIYKSSMQPHLMVHRYVLEQFMSWYGRKLVSYWKKYRAPGQIVAIADEDQIPTVDVNGLHGEFDIEVDVVDEYESDMVKKQQLSEVFGMIGQNPVLAQNVDIPQMLVEWLKLSKVDYTKIVKPSTDIDAREMARNENKAMKEGIPAQVRPGENLGEHLKEHMGERLRYKGLEADYPNVQFLDQHIEETKLAQQQQGAQLSGGPGAAPQGPEQAAIGQSEGELASNPIEAAMGAMQGGGPSTQ